MRKKAMNLDVRQCKPSELPLIINRLDKEFVSSKQRSLSLIERFPNTLSLENLEQIRVVMSDGLICGACAIRVFDWISEERTWRGAMVGMVWVDPHFRHKGVGTQLMTSVAGFLREKGVNFGVLWTGRPTLYERSGWVLNDLGLFGEVKNRLVSPCINEGLCRSLISVKTAWLECLRSRLVPYRIVRNALDYRTLPIPADRVYCFSAQDNKGGEGFALVGEHDGTGYFYEMVASPGLWEKIWAAVAGRFDRILLNGHTSDPFSQWLAENRLVVWQPQNKTMWLRISGRVEGNLLNAWHIPYFDWI